MLTPAVAGFVLDILRATAERVSARGPARRRLKVAGMKLTIGAEAPSPTHSRGDPCSLVKEPAARRRPRRPCSSRVAECNAPGDAVNGQSDFFPARRQPPRPPDLAFAHVRSTAARREHSANAYTDEEMLSPIHAESRRARNSCRNIRSYMQLWSLAATRRRAATPAPPPSLRRAGPQVRSIPSVSPGQRASLGRAATPGATRLRAVGALR